jgi:Cyclic nucleotide-binding domain
MNQIDVDYQPSTIKRITSSVTTVSWIPSEMVRGLPRLAFDVGATHYDEPPPDRIDGPDHLDRLEAAGRFRFVNELRAWVDVLDGRIVNAGYSGRSRMNTTSVKMGKRTGLVFQPIPFPDLRAPVELDAEHATFVQTAGGRTGLPAPRHTHRLPYFGVAAPPAWTTLGLTIHADGRAEHELVGASEFPRHWIYGPDGLLVAKSGLTRFGSWYRGTLRRSSPWRSVDSAALVTAASSALERELSASLLHNHKVWRVRRLAAGEVLVRQGEPGGKLFVLLDGVLNVQVDGEDVGDVVPGAVVGEHALLRRGSRTATLRAATDVSVAVISEFDPEDGRLAGLAPTHCREEATC